MEAEQRVSGRHACVSLPLFLVYKDGDEERTGNYQSSAWGLGTVISSHMPHITLLMTLDGESEEEEEEWKEEEEE